MSARDNRRALAFGSFARNGLIGVRMGVDADGCEDVGGGATGGGDSGAGGGAAAIGARATGDGGGTVGLADVGGISG